MEADRRRSPRMRTLWAGVVAYDNRRATLSCTVRNASAGGALLKVSDTVTLPPSFQLDISSRQRRHAVAMVWRQGEAMGVRFAGALAEPDSALARQLKASEAAKLQLEERVRQLTEGA